MQAHQHLVVGRQADDPQPPHAAERLRLADLAALVDVGPGDSAGALAGDGIGQDRDDGAEILAVEFVERLLRVGLIEIDALAPAERFDVLERPPDRRVAHVDAADVAQIGFAWRACDRLQAGEDSAPRSFVARPRSSAASSRAAVLPRRFRFAISSGVGSRRDGVPAFSPISAFTASANEHVAQMHFELDDVAAFVASAAKPGVGFGPDANRSSPPQTGQAPTSVGPSFFSLAPAIFADSEPRAPVRVRLR